MTSNIKGSKFYYEKKNNYSTDYILVNIPASFCSFANVVAVLEDFSIYYHYFYPKTHLYPLIPEYFHQAWVRLPSMLKALNNQLAYTSRSLTASCDHFCPTEGCQALCP